MQFIHVCFVYTFNTCVHLNKGGKSYLNPITTKIVNAFHCKVTSGTYWTRSLIMMAEKVNRNIKINKTYLKILIANYLIRIKVQLRSSLVVNYLIYLRKARKT